MQVELLPKKGKVKFSEVENGSYFVLNGGVYRKIQPVYHGPSFRINAYRVDNNPGIYAFLDNEPVEKVCPVGKIQFEFV